MRRFYGWEPTQTTVRVVENRRLVKTLTTQESEWDDEQRGWMLALAEFEKQQCGGCGGWLPDTTDVLRSDGYVADHPLRCHRCEALTIMRKKVQGNPNAEAFTVWPVHERGG